MKSANSKEDGARKVDYDLSPPPTVDAFFLNILKVAKNYVYPVDVYFKEDCLPPSLSSFLLMPLVRPCSRLPSLVYGNDALLGDLAATSLITLFFYDLVAFIAALSISFSLRTAFLSSTFITSYTTEYFIR